MHETMIRLVEEMDLDQVLSMLKALQQALRAEPPSTVPFALFLDFKCKILDCILKIWPLEKLHDLHPLLHPLECVCK
jgi:hypothetical protein